MGVDRAQTMAPQVSPAMTTKTIPFCSCVTVTAGRLPASACPLPDGLCRGSVRPNLRFYGAQIAKADAPSAGLPAAKAGGSGAVRAARSPGTTTRGAFFHRHVGHRGEDRGAGVGLGGGEWGRGAQPSVLIVKRG